MATSNHADRQEYLQRTVDKLRQRNNSQHITVNQLKHREQSRQDFGIIKKAMKPSRSKGIQFLDIPDEHNPDAWIRITDPQQIAEILITWNIQHFGQSKQTPFAQKQLTTLFGYQGVNQAATQIIKDKIIPGDISGKMNLSQCF
jgi:hypothetical protein